MSIFGRGLGGPPPGPGSGDGVPRYGHDVSDLPTQPIEAIPPYPHYCPACVIGFREQNTWGNLQPAGFPRLCAHHLRAFLLSRERSLLSSIIAGLEGVIERGR